MNTAYTICAVVASASFVGMVLLFTKLFRVDDSKYFIEIERSHFERECESLRQELFALRKEIENLKHKLNAHP